MVPVELRAMRDVVPEKWGTEEDQRRMASLCGGDCKLNKGELAPGCLLLGSSTQHDTRPVWACPLFASPYYACKYFKTAYNFRLAV